MDELVLRRIVRIMPTYWASLAVTLGLRELAPEAFLATSWTEVGQHVAMVFHPGVGKLNEALWSLVIEMQVSMLIPLFILAFMQRPKLPEATVLFGVSFLFPAFLTTVTWLSFLPQFIGGVLLAYLMPVVSERVRSAPAWMRWMAGLGGAALFWNHWWQHRWAFPDMIDGYLCGLGSAVAITLVGSTPQPWRLFSSAPARFFGAISYSLYLMHLPVVVTANALLRRSGVGEIPLAVIAVLARGQIE